MLLRFTPPGIELAYRNGVFPMYDDEHKRMLWFQPDPRTIIPLEGFHISRSLAKTLRQGRFLVRYNTDFMGVMRGCADREEGTWISEEFFRVYGELHRQGKAHSIEAWQEGRLVGGTYGVALGGAFMAESMFHYETDASKVVLANLVQRLNERGFTLLDCQYLTPHLKSLGALEIPNDLYLQRLNQATILPCEFD